jgi:hypothetical protein
MKAAFVLDSVILPVLLEMTEREVVETLQAFDLVSPLMVVWSTVLGLAKWLEIPASQTH